jgi:pimeloyl-ACP methyl ester carboxylesterase
MTKVRFRPIPHPSWLPKSTWPFQSFGIEANGSRLAVTEAGKGPVLLFVHVGTWSFIWRDLITRLASDFRCIFFDAPGNGQTQDVSANAVTMEGAAGAVEAVIEALDLRDLTLVAHDLGGPAALAALAGIPERVRGIVAMNAFGWSPSGAAFRGMLGLMGSRVMREFDVLTELIPRIAATPFGVGRHMDEVSRGAFRAGIGARGLRAFHDYIRDASHCEGLYRRVARALDGPLGQAPLLTIFGERNDPFGFQKHWKELFPEARQVVVAKGNHFPMCDDPDLVARAIQGWYRECVSEAAALVRFTQRPQPQTAP